MIKLKDILLESKAPSVFIPRRVEDRLERYIKSYIKNGSKGDLNLEGFGFTKLPDLLKYVTNVSSFICSNNNLTSLVGAPKSVSGHFDCSHNYLTTLEGVPQNVESVDCHNNNLTSLKGSPTSSVNSFDCSGNKLTSLVGTPQNVDNDFNCSYNNLTSLDGAPKTVGGDFYCDNNPVKFTEEQVRAVCNVDGIVYV